MKTILLLFVSALAFAQTAPRPDQLRAPADVAIRAVFFLPSGQAVVAVLDATWVLDTSANPPVMRSVAPAPVVKPPQVDVIKATGPVTAVTTSQLPIEEPDVSVGGVLQSPGEDYTRSGRQITLKTPAQSGDVIRIKYHF